MTTKTRNEVVKDIRHALRFRSGRAWSVTVGRGTVWGYIYINAPKKDQVRGCMTVADRHELARLMGLLDTMVHHQGIMVSPEEYDEMEQRARGLWDGQITPPPLD
jgi:hypothetical protein